MRNPRLTHDFDHDSELWQIYDAERSVALLAEKGPQGFHDIYRAPTWERTGGVNDSGYIWADDSRWSLDEPETPRSILPLLTWRQWYLRGPVDLRDAELSVYLRGDGLDLKGGRCYFWVNSLTYANRWHLTSQPLPIEPGRWADRPVVVTLRNDESLWHRSWTVPTAQKNPLDRVLSSADSYGFAFVGFSEMVTGRFCVDEFSLRVAKP